jgi:hypothetical protein
VHGEMVVLEWTTSGSQAEGESEAGEGSYGAAAVENSPASVVAPYVGGRDAAIWSTAELRLRCLRCARARMVLLLYLCKRRCHFRPSCGLEQGRVVPVGGCPRAGGWRCTGRWWCWSGQRAGAKLKESLRPERAPTGLLLLKIRRRPAAATHAAGRVWVCRLGVSWCRGALALCRVLEGTRRGQLLWW